MKLTNHFLIRLVIPLTLGMLLLGIITLAVVYSKTPAWISSIEASILNDSFSGFQSRSSSRAQYVNEIMNGLELDTATAATYARDVLGASNSVSLNVVRPYPSFFGAQIDSPLVDPPQPNSSTIPFVDLYFNVNITTTAGLSSMPLNTTILDDAFRAVSLNKAQIQTIYMGFEDRGLRKYPYQYTLEQSNSFRTDPVCSRATFSVSSALRATNGYIPACRGWYNTAAAAARNTSSASTTNGTGPVIATPPYIDFFTKRTLITYAQSVVGPSGVLGVMAIDVSIDSMKSQILRSSVLANGYIFMVGPFGNIIVYPEQKIKNGLDIYANPTDVSVVEFNGNTAMGRSFLQSLQRISTRGETANITKPDGSLWYYAARLVPSGGYFIVTMVPSDDVSGLSQQMKSRTTVYSIIAIIIMAICLVLLTGLAYYISAKIANYVLNPISELSSWLDKIAQADLSVELGEKAPVSAELNVIHEHFKHLLVAIRFGNDAYYANDLDRALENYIAAEKMMTEFRNERGLGICLNNKGNAYKQMGSHFREALDSYNLAIQNARGLADVETDASRKKAYEIVLANRYMNLGVLYKDLRPASAQTTEVAEKNFKESLQIHRKYDNIEGISQVSGNLGQCYLDQGRIQEASDLIRDSYMLAKTKQNPVSLQYAIMNMGILAEHLDHLEEACSWYMYVLQKYDVVVTYVQRFCYERLVNLTSPSMLNKEALHQALKEVGDPIFGQVDQDGNSVQQKDIAFVLDCSGSMAGSFIRACRESLIEIVRNHTNEGDRISLTAFNDRSRSVFPLTARVGDNLNSMVHSIKYKTEPGGATAFWDALLDGINSMGSLGPNANKPDPNGKKIKPSGRKSWVIALTDGMDNASKPGSFQNVLKTLGRNPTVSVVVISVGSLENEDQIRKACRASRDGGLLIRADTSGDAIKQAFERATKFMMGNLKVESF